MKMTKESLLKVIGAADDVISALAGTNDEVHKDDTDKMVRLWDDLNDQYAPPEVVRELARLALAAMDSEPAAPVAEVVSIYGDPEAFGEREIRPLVGIQQMPYGTKLYRHAQQPVVESEPVAEVLSNRPGNDTSTIDRALPVGTQLYRHAQTAPVVPEEATPDSIEILASARRRDHAVFQWNENQRNAAADSWNACRAAMLQAKSLISINPAPAMVSLPKNAESMTGNSPVNDVTAGKPFTILLPDISSKAFWSGAGKNENFHPETYRRWVKEAIERYCAIARINVEVK
ncbi:Uncharacterised protein [Klebsiella variicola]|nr:Uncharacterised protein [Klebsiella variicola]SLW53338.1 Uncharacterised protein [Klebsiella variicola]SLZ48607.1 Uncharacterised protein [Klebsiella variicola]SMA02654.1 Uncharacterised protein [Klebsiella variicola]SMA13461.1 Uncharacterised protein [Klebsiella variicola]